jgi:hypothetical protein
MVYHSAIRPLHIPPFSRDFSPKSQETKGKQRNRNHQATNRSNSKTDESTGIVSSLLTVTFPSIRYHPAVRPHNNELKRTTRLRLSLPPS